MSPPTATPEAAFAARQVRTESPRLLRLVLQYSGTRYRGWQLQPDAPTVQGELERVFSRLLDEPARVMGAARTDSGVHARGQVAMIRTRSSLSELRLLAGANAILPDDIRVAELVEAPPGFHVQRDILAKEYRYRYWTGPFVPVWLREFVAPADAGAGSGADAGRFREGAAHLLGTHDFTGFSCAGSSTVRPVRTILVSELNVDGPLWTWRIAADGFLYRMVRCLAGTLLEVARGRLPIEKMDAVLAAGRREAGVPVAPARGLTLERIDYAPPGPLESATSEAPGAASGDRFPGEGGR